LQEINYEGSATGGQNAETRPHFIIVLMWPLECQWRD